MRPDYAQVHSNLGHALWKSGRVDEAIAACRRAIELRPDYAASWVNLGNALLDAGRCKDAIAAQRQALILAPDEPAAHFNLGIALLTSGDYPSAWPHYDWRWRVPGFTSAPRQFSQPQWTGENPAGLRILVHAEQGLGDAIQFARFVPQIAMRGAMVYLESPPALVPLLQTLDGPARVIAVGEPHPEFDRHCPLLSVPGILKISTSDLPGPIPYLRCESSRIKFWQQRMAQHGGRLRIGLAWAGSPKHLNDRQRSLPPAFLAPLASIPGARFFSLQKGGDPGQNEMIPTDLHLIDWTSELSDLAETAALVANLDLVLSVDSAVVHLAGALGKPAWVLLAAAPDWRWMHGRTDSIWYPSARLFRQTVPGDWTGPIRQVAAELRK